MQQALAITDTSRKILGQILKEYSLVQLNTIPIGYSNNLIWNIAHVIVVQQMLVYKLSGLEMMISDEMVHKYKKGSKPENDVTQSEVDEIYSLLFKTIDKTKRDFDNHVFQNYQEYTTMLGNTLKSAKDAIAFNYYHEALHTGIIMSIRKFIE